MVEPGQSPAARRVQRRRRGRYGGGPVTRPPRRADRAGGGGGGGSTAAAETAEGSSALGTGLAAGGGGTQAAERGAGGSGGGRFARFRAGGRRKSSGASGGGGGGAVSSAACACGAGQAAGAAGARRSRIPRRHRVHAEQIRRGPVASAGDRCRMMECSHERGGGAYAVVRLEASQCAPWTRCARASARLEGCRAGVDLATPPRRARAGSSAVTARPSAPRRQQRADTSDHSKIELAQRSPGYVFVHAGVVGWRGARS